MKSISRIGLGTVQFALAYGVSNRAGRPDEGEVAAILARAVALGIRTLDTAVGYGDAESLIGRNLPAGHDMKIVTKTPPLDAAMLDASHGRALVDAIARSCERLKVERLHGVLLHHAADLAKPGAEHLVAALREIKARGLADRIGVSVYDADELALATSTMRPELVQLPVNALDRRLIEAQWPERLRAMGAEVHARSVFLQGLLLMGANEAPRFFAPIASNLAMLRARWHEQGCSPLAGCLAFALSHPQISTAIVGVNRVAELDEIAAAAEAIDGSAIEAGPPSPIDPIYLDPRRWPATAA